METSVFGKPKISMPNFTKVENQKPLPDGAIMGLILGQSGTGKSFLLLSLIPLIGQLSQVVICSLIVGNPVYLRIAQWCKANKIDYGFASDPSTARKTIEEMINKKKEDTYCLCIFDDFSQASASKSNEFNNVMIMTYQLLRNYGCHSITLTQDFTNVPTLCRNNCTFLVAFKAKNKFGLWSMSRDFENMTHYTSDHFMSVYRLVQTSEHGFIMVSEGKVYVYLDSGPSKTQGVQEVQFDTGNTPQEEEEPDEEEASDD
jgi:archaellum biogenesis ATPase FlaH